MNASFWSCSNFAEVLLAIAMDGWSYFSNASVQIQEQFLFPLVPIVDKHSAKSGAIMSLLVSLHSPTVHKYFFVLAGLKD
jgi:hypothetical protein